jgi:hypothetical protein
LGAGGRRKNVALTDEQLIADLLATFPGVHARPAREYGRPEFIEGVWMAGEADMPDGYPMFSTLHYGEPEYEEGDVHVGLQRWIEERGYFVETWDHGVYFAVPSNRRLL